MNRKILWGLIKSFSIMITLSACASMPCPLIDEPSISNIKPGKTTKAEIIELFGIPDVIVCDSQTTIVPENSHLSALMEYFERNRKKMPTDYWNNCVIYLAGYVENRKGYSLSQDQITLIYFDTFFQLTGLKSGSAQSKQYNPLHIDIDNTQIAGNELAVFIDKKNNIVLDYAYRKEWNWEQYNVLARQFINRIDRSAGFPQSEINKFSAEKYCSDVTN